MAGRKKITPAPELPPEILLFQILPRLPAKSLLRFKCVCKQWRSFLATPLFANIQLHHATAADRREKLVFCTIGSTSPCNFLTIDCEDGLVAQPRCCPFPGFAAATVTSSVNGLACMGIWKNAQEFSDLILWNPLTGEYKTLSRPVDRKCYRTSFIALGLYHTRTDDDYKILRINADSSVYIYSLKSDSWRKLESELDYHERIPYAGDHHDLLDESLHFLMKLKTRYLIIRLDLKTEKFTKIAVPSTCPYGCLRFVVGKGCIQLTIFKARSFFWNTDHRGMADGWRWQLDESGKQHLFNTGLVFSGTVVFDEEWKLAHVYQQRHLQSRPCREQRQGPPLVFNSSHHRHVPARNLHRDFCVTQSICSLIATN